VVFVSGVLKNMRNCLDEVNIVEVLVVVLLVLLLCNMGFTFFLVDLLRMVFLETVIMVVSWVKHKVVRVFRELVLNVSHMISVTERQFIKVVS
jgi:hypothetical protein